MAGYCWAHSERSYYNSEEVGYASSVYDVKLHNQVLYLCIEACLADYKVVYCIKKVCKGGGMLWYGHTFGFWKY